MEAKHYLKMLPNRHNNTIEWYLAQIAQEICKLRGYKADDLKSFLIDFAEKKPEQKPAEISEEDAIEHKRNVSALSRAKWFAAVGMDKDGVYKPQSGKKKPVPKPKPKVKSNG